MAREKDPIPTSRIRRLSIVGLLAACQAAKQLGTRAANVARSDEKSVVALECWQIEDTEQNVADLGTE